MSVQTPSLPSPKVIHVDTRGAVILSEESPEVPVHPTEVLHSLTSGDNRQEIAEAYTFPTTLNPFHISQWM